MEKTMSPETTHQEAIEFAQSHAERPKTPENGGQEDNTRRTRSLVRKIDLRLVPLCSFLYLLNYLDRSNIGNGKVLNSETGDSLLQQTGMTTRGYSITITLFAVAYSAFDVPSNWIMKRYVRPSAGVQDYATVIVLRFLIGVFEAGFFPAIVYLITFWYRVEERSLRIAFVLASASLAGAFGGSIAYGVGHLNGKAGLQGFRWLFIIEGLLTVFCTVLLLFFLPNWPSTARWLSEDEKKFAEDRLVEQGGGFTRAHATRKEILETCLSPRMLVHYTAYLTNTVVLGSLTYFSPTIVAGLGYTSNEAQLMTVPPWVIGYICSLLLAWSADHYNARGWHVTFAAIISGVGWLTAALLPAHAYTKRYGCLILIACGAFPGAAPLSAWVTCNVSSVVTMGLAAALNNSVVGVASIILVWVWKADEAKIGFPTGNFTCAACSFATAILAAGLRLYYGRLNTRNLPDASGQARIWLL